ncbi:ABC transporter permease [Glycomyces harbinensis]|uniref:ABC-type nitrate/sulfonate/bicarbonate transport system, permease component n=1 Tax=Glycomyces harbinensis TaxID=58114 RepID=A0A1G6TLY6_9ACTN|nr:ABC transporter permease [Glycomyces harbinensis]SDD29335.1 ABC-type nitrate/sulfonate/bicarbonate transport system, permease component [Glycomyces harbinensis]
MSRNDDRSPAGTRPAEARSGPDRPQARRRRHPRPRPRPASPRRTPLLLGAAGVAAALAIGQILPHTGLVDPDYTPTTGAVAAALADDLVRSEFWRALADTLTAWALGLAIAVAAGAVLGILIGSLPFVRAATASTVEFLRPIPSVALVPLAVLLFGTRLPSTLLLVVYAAFWQVLVQVLAGVRDIDPVAADTARSFRLSPWERLRHLAWPTALPYLMTGVRLAATVALVLAITAELVIGSPGLGHEIAVAQSSGATERMYALIWVAGGLGVLVNLAVRAVERGALGWHPSVRSEATA